MRLCDYNGDEEKEVIAGSNEGHFEDKGGEVHVVKVKSLPLWMLNMEIH